MRIYPDTLIPKSKRKSDINQLLLAQWPYENGRYIKGRGWQGGFQEAVEMWIGGFNNWLIYHTKDSTGSKGGFPDLVCAHQITHTMLYAELKIEKGSVSEDQKKWLLTLAGNPTNHVYLWYPSDEDEIMTFLKAEQDKAIGYNR